MSALPLLNGFWRLFYHKHESSNKYTIIILKWKETAAHQQLKHSRKRLAVVERKDSKYICEDRERVQTWERHGACHYTHVNAGISTQVVFDQLLFSVAAQVKAIQPKLGSNFAKPHIGDVGTYSTFPILYINRLPRQVTESLPNCWYNFPLKKKRKIISSFLVCVWSCPCNLLANPLNKFPPHCSAPVLRPQVPPTILCSPAT